MACGALPSRWGTTSYTSPIHVISEMEAIALRKTSGVFSEPQNLVDKPIFHQALSNTERRPRAELIRVANSYFEGMEAGTDKNTPFDKDCQRIENGVITSNDPASKSEITRTSCGAQFARGLVITRVQERRRSINPIRFSSRSFSRLWTARSIGLRRW
jgi:hypothetical protein